MNGMFCLPGLLCEPEVFDPLLAALDSPAQVIPQVIPLPSGSDFDTIADTIAAQLPQDALILGMSMGSYLALRIATRHPAKVAGLILIGTNAAADTPIGAAQRGKTARYAAREGMEALSKLVADIMLSPARFDDEGLRETMRRMAVAQGVEHFTDHQTALASRPDQQADLAGIVCPVLVITGSADKVTTPEASRAVAEGVANGRYVELAGVGHIAVLEAPADVARLVDEFARNLTRREERTQ